MPGPGPLGRRGAAGRRPRRRRPDRRRRGRPRAAGRGRTSSWSASCRSTRRTSRSSTSGRSWSPTRPTPTGRPTAWRSSASGSGAGSRSSRRRRRPGVGLDDRPVGGYDLLGVIRVYTKVPGKPADRSHPFTLPIGEHGAGPGPRGPSRPGAVAEVRQGLGLGAFDGQTVKRDHELQRRRRRRAARLIRGSIRAAEPTGPSASGEASMATALIVEDDPDQAELVGPAAPATATSTPIVADDRRRRAGDWPGGSSPTSILLDLMLPDTQRLRRLPAAPGRPRRRCSPRSSCSPPWATT